MILMIITGTVLNKLLFVTNFQILTCKERELNSVNGSSRSIHPESAALRLEQGLNQFASCPYSVATVCENCAKKLISSETMADKKFSSAARLTSAVCS